MKQIAKNVQRTYDKGGNIYQATELIKYHTFVLILDPTQESIGSDIVTFAYR